MILLGASVASPQSHLLSCGGRPRARREEGTNTEKQEGGAAEHWPRLCPLETGALGVLSSFGKQMPSAQMNYQADMCRKEIMPSTAAITFAMYLGLGWALSKHHLPSLMRWGQ